jgi:hypothetical protein
MTKEEKNQMVDAQLKQYERQIFQMEMTKTGLLANDDVEGAKGMDSRIETLRKAYEAVGLMKEA